MTTSDSYSDQSDDARSDESESAAEATRSHGTSGGGSRSDAGDRTSSYEGFGQMIADNVRRSGDLMLEMLAMRDSMAQALEREGLRERERLGANLADVEAGLEAMRTQIVALAGQVGSLRRSLPMEPSPRPRPAASQATLTREPAPAREETSEQFPAPPPAPRTPDERPAEPDAVPAAPTARAATVDAWPAPRVIDVIVHQVHRATVALSLQRYLGALAGVAGVEAREFAEGVLRMQVTARQPLTSSDFDGWTDGGPFSMLQMQPTVIELTLADRA